MRDHGRDHLVEVLRFIERPRLLGIDAARGAVDLELVALVEVRDRGIADRPDVLDAVHAGICRGDGVPGMPGHAHAELVRLVGHDGDQIGWQKFAELERVVAVSLLGLHDRASCFGIWHLHVVAPGARTLGLELAGAETERLAGHPQPRAADLAAGGAVLLRQRPGAVLLGFDLDAGESCRCAMSHSQNAARKRLC
jgi:hypothetical protein